MLSSEDALSRKRLRIYWANRALNLPLAISTASLYCSRQARVSCKPRVLQLTTRLRQVKVLLERNVRDFFNRSVLNKYDMSNKQAKRAGGGLWSEGSHAQARRKPAAMRARAPVRVDRADNLNERRTVDIRPKCKSMG